MINQEDVFPLNKKASAIHTEAYLKREFISVEDLNEEGLFIDAHTARAEQILVEMNNKQTTIRHIKTDEKDGGILSLPTLKHFEIDPAILKQVTGVSRLSEIRPSQVVELSGLASITSEGPLTLRQELAAFDATRQVYSKSLRVALEEGHNLWVMNVDEKMFNFLALTLGEDSYTVIGEKKQYMGPETTPIAMKPFDVVQSVFEADNDEGRYSMKNKKDLQHALAGVSERHLPPKLIKLLKENDVETTPLERSRKAWNEIWKNKKTEFYALILGYSAIRFAGVGAVEEFDGSLPLFAAIDVGTAITQVASMEMFFKGKNRTTRALGVVGTGASFVAPYAYFWANGEGYPPYVNVVAGAVLAVGVGLETRKSMSDSQLKKGLIESDLSTEDNEPQISQPSPLGN